MPSEVFRSDSWSADSGMARALSSTPQRPTPYGGPRETFDDSVSRCSGPTSFAPRVGKDPSHAMSHTRERAAAHKNLHTPSANSVSKHPPQPTSGEHPTQTHEPLDYSNR